MARRPLSAEARGKRRLLRQQLAADAARLLATARSARARTLTEGWVHKRGNGRARAQAHLNALFGLRLRLVNDRYLGWLFLKPGGRVVMEDDAADPGLGQDCVAVHALLAGLLPGRVTAGISSCIWALGITDHAIGRLLERSPRADPVAVMIAAHDALMRAGPCDGFWNELWVPARGWGAFKCEAIAGEVSDMPGTGVLHVRARTWFDADQLTDQPLIAEAMPHERLGASLMLPALVMPQPYSDALLAL